MDENLNLDINNKDLVLACMIFKNEELSRQIKKVKSNNTILTITTGVLLYTTYKFAKKLDEKERVVYGVNFNQE